MPGEAAHQGMSLKKIAGWSFLGVWVLLAVVFTLSVRVRLANSKATYISAQSAVAYCNSVDITLMPETHRQAHNTKCAESREIAMHPPTMEEMIVYQANEYMEAVVKYVMTWKVLMTAAVSWIGLVLGWLFLWDRPRMRRRLRAMEDEDEDVKVVQDKTRREKKDIY